MEESHNLERKFPPRSKFNDEEATAVLRLIIEQEKLLKNANVSPLLNVVSTNRLQRLPPLNAKRSESLDENDLENVRTRKSSGDRSEPGSELFFNKPTLLTKSKDLHSSDNTGTLPGRPARIPDIYSSPKMAKHRDRSDRPKGSYGRTRHTEQPTTSNSDEEIHENGYTSLDSGYLDEGESKISSNIPRYSPSYIN